MLCHIQGWISDWLYFDLLRREDNYQIINYIIDEAHRGRGYGSEAARLCLDYFKRKFNAKRVSLPVHANNKRAQKFWTKLGFKMSDTVEDDNVFMRIYYE